LKAKYRFLSEIGSSVSTAPSQSVEADRAARIFAIICANHSRPRQILDVGGSDGHLMLPFLSQGAECFLVDFSTGSLSGITRLGDTIIDVPRTMTFDAVICSHVLEHVAEPRHILTEAHQRMHDGSIIYVEVPVELFHNNVWNPIHAEPVTHVNFFTTESLRHILLTSGYRIALLEECLSTYQGKPLPVIRAVASKVNPHTVAVQVGGGSFG
jgi:2-polyprenyl-3-methyl-5-hydroxy-6-metoxy-1,4-benzoquinol methylase